MKTLKIRTPLDIVQLVNLMVGHVPQNSLVIMAKCSSDGPSEFNGSLRVDFDRTVASHITESEAAKIAALLTRFPNTEFVVPVFCSDDIADALGQGSGEYNDQAAEDLETAVERIMRAFLKAGYEAANPVWMGRNKCAWFNDPTSLCKIEDVTTGTQLPPLVALPSVRPLVDAHLQYLRTRDIDNPFGALRDDLIDLIDTKGTPDHFEGWKDVPLRAESVLAVEALDRTDLCVNVLMAGFSGQHPLLKSDTLRQFSADKWLETVVNIAVNTPGENIAGFNSEKPDLSYLFNVLMYLKLIAVHVEQEHFGSVLSVIAWFEWAIGHNSYAEHYAQSALAMNAGSPLARVVNHFVSHAVLAPWTYQ